MTGNKVPVCKSMTALTGLGYRSHMGDKPTAWVTRFANGFG